jgi:16S rRNA (cytidine1402-2'-O)-methyltransferase
MQAKSIGKLFLIPTTMGESNVREVLPIVIKETIERLNHYIVENEKTARKSIKDVFAQKKQSDLILFTLNKRTDVSDYQLFIQPLLDGIDMGLMSEAGCPGVADPGAEIVKLAHEKGIQVVPMVGPSSILMAMMASGMNGQSFTFNGYLPIDKGEKKTAIRQLEKLSFEKNQSQLFIETPYRNNTIFEDLLQILQQDTLLCVAADITLSTECIKTLKVKDWKKTKVDLHNRPAIFIIHKG